jgi:hypothetical protein
VDSSQPDVPCASAVFASAFQVIEEEANEWRVEVFDPELGGAFAELFLGKLQEQAKGIAISRNCMWARLSLAKQTISEERLKERRKASRNHGCTSR